jgi:hypothetical protein
LQNFFHTTHDTRFKADFDAVGMRRGLGQKILHDAFGPFSGPLVLFLYDSDPISGFDMGPVLSAQWNASNLFTFLVT